MKIYTRRKLYLVTLVLLYAPLLYAQTDSIHSLFNKPKKLRPRFRYSYLQWDVGYAGFFFQDEYLNAFRTDILGAVFNNDLNLAFGVETSYNAYNYGVPTNAAAVHSFGMLYFKAEPMIFPEEVINLSLPFILSSNTLKYTTGNALYSYGRHHREPSEYFPSATCGVNVLINLYKRLGFGIGAAYRFSFLTRNSTLLQPDYDNFSATAFLRVRVNTHALHGYAVPDKNDYYRPK